MGDSREPRDYLKEKIDETYEDIQFTMDELRGIFTRAGIDTQSLGTPERADIRKLFYIFEKAIYHRHGSAENPDNENDDMQSGNASNVPASSSNPVERVPQDDRSNMSHRENPRSHGADPVNPRN